MFLYVALAIVGVMILFSVVLPLLFFVLQEEFTKRENERARESQKRHEEWREEMDIAEKERGKRVYREYQEWKEARNGQK
ncbi:MAG: hypothetical protein A3A98_03385 [Candidatus Staskawiczbacteria bacterium RIFCSPLOWO2_01_FULL_40_39]|uniref:Uncharacterized protein n=1 Tax=Candidatus Staskawiczbacteria bacterium RIFCSPHIGHO2_01_FULL_39_25 TaxID=1802202 RepID=A0A1G2HPV1_9BACT|nr:MAG: hypothetical protein A2730_02660 [Candidatus Staskawiczbacteria bacterium RIFCSPHIGHO2_01_FULL_39_25]OGZ72857.1 MAG: hypothetical protein A3A98_03385 [Candidatus Staskawiczbacteria bacterium RIFCSPLOWO2_01_FULL_40_39]OGZ75218.1 MAG: hypothetical protein A3I87_00905 [Candidatus Staskawiczbacteria bacterium RIFCSPLOWO2_02_FULL_39_8]